LAYLVKDTFQYTGDQHFDTLEEFLQYFWQGSFDDILSLLSEKTDSANVDNIGMLQTNVVSHDWNPQTKVYVRIVDFNSPVDYLSHRTSVNSLQWQTDIQLEPFLNDNLNLVKTTEFIG